MNNSKIRKLLIIIFLATMFIPSCSPKDKLIIKLKNDDKIVELAKTNSYAIFNIDTTLTEYIFKLIIIPEENKQCVASYEFIELSNKTKLPIINIDEYLECSNIIITGGGLYVKSFKNGGVTSVVNLQ